MIDNLIDYLHNQCIMMENKNSNLMGFNHPYRYVESDTSQYK